MSLNWNATKTPAYADLLERQKEDPDATYSQEQVNVLDTLIWGSLTVDLPGIPKEEDVDEFLFRLRFAQRVGNYSPTLPDHTGPIHVDDLVALPERAQDGKTWTPRVTADGEKVTRFGGTPEDHYYVARYRLPTREEMEEWVGLTTNVTRKTRHQFCSRQSKMAREDVERQVARMTVS